MFSHKNDLERREDVGDLMTFKVIQGSSGSSMWNGLGSWTDAEGFIAPEDRRD